MFLWAAGDFDRQGIRLPPDRLCRGPASHPPEMVDGSADQWSARMHACACKE